MKLSIINIYLPRSKTGPTGSYNQTLNTIRTLQKWEDAVGVEKYFYSTIVECIKEDVKEGFKVILGGDFNEDNTEDGGMAKGLRGLNLINTTSPPNMKTPVTYNRGSNTIDHIWISSELIPLMKRFGYLPFDFGFDADHRGMFVDIWSKDENMARIPVRRRCKLKSKNPKTMNK